MTLPLRATGRFLFLAGMVTLAPCGVIYAGGPSTKAAKLDAPALTQLIDKAIQERLAAEKIQPAPLADDAEFLRRVYLDIIGMTPSADKVRAFLDSKDPDKRAKAIDELLANPLY